MDGSLAGWMVGTTSASLYCAGMVATCDQKCFQALCYNPVLASWQVAVPGRDGSGAFYKSLCTHCPSTLPLALSNNSRKSKNHHLSNSQLCKDPHYHSEAMVLRLYNCI